MCVCVAYWQAKRWRRTFTSQMHLFTRIGGEDEDKWGVSFAFMPSRSSSSNSSRKNIANFWIHRYRCRCRCHCAWNGNTPPGSDVTANWLLLVQFTPHQGHRRFLPMPAKRNTHTHTKRNLRRACFFVHFRKLFVVVQSWFLLVIFVCVFLFVCSFYIPSEPFNRRAICHAKKKIFIQKTTRINHEKQSSE